MGEPLAVKVTVVKPVPVNVPEPENDTPFTAGILIEYGPAEVTATLNVTVCVAPTELPAVYTPAPNVVVAQVKVKAVGGGANEPTNTYILQTLVPNEIVKVFMPSEAGVPTAFNLIIFKPVFVTEPVPIK